MDKGFFKNWVLHIPHRLRDILWIVRAWSSVAPILSSLIMSWASSCVQSSQSLLKVITSFWHKFLEWMNSMILGVHSRWPSPRLHSWLLYRFKLFLIWKTLMTAWSLHSSTSFLRSFYDFCSSLQIAWSMNQTCLVSLRKTLVVQVDSWLNQKWSS